jgi:hypothetical protein
MESMMGGRRSYLGRLEKAKAKVQKKAQTEAATRTVIPVRVIYAAAKNVLVPIPTSLGKTSYHEP